MADARLLLLMCPLLLTGGRPALSNADRPAEPNDNRVAAGVLREGVLSVALEVRRTTWHPDGDSLPGMAIDAFAEVGKHVSVPGPLLRMPVGTEVRGSLRNALEHDTVTFYIPARVRHAAPAGQLDSIAVPPGETRELRFMATTPGTYFYRATSGQVTYRPRLRIDGLLSGALIVDSARTAGTPRDRVFVMQSAPEAFGSDERVAPPVMAINGRSWPHTERLTATVGDTMHWRVINASTEVHPMHLHGFYYRVDALHLESEVQQHERPAPGRMVVTERMPATSTMDISWTPERPGNWLFHCHFQQHVLPHRPIGESSARVHVDRGHAGHDDHASSGMGGLVLGIFVAPKAGEAVTESSPGTRRLRLVAIHDRGFPDSFPSMRFVLEEPGAPRLDAGPGFSPPISLMRGQPVSVMVVNRLPEPTAVHWHGIEIDSYYDGVAGFSGSGKRLAPVIAPGDSFEVRMTPPRSGTFIYHSHVDEPRQHRAGLAGALIVRESGQADDVEEHTLFVKNARAGVRTGAEFEINGRQNPDTLVLRAGRRYRLRFIGLQVTNPNASVSLTARTDTAGADARDTSLVHWRPLAKDAMDLPESERAPREARQEIGMGETYDFEFVPNTRGELRIEVRVMVPRPRLMVRVPIRVE